ncbi:MAG TPA: TonB-dependent receptor, partial [Candidatus Hodarchaeales archaeon]|nr:TonB-dependent receptor [Candidatus Hodarchaeales archaeon]
SYFDALLKYTDLAADYSVLPYFFDVNSKLDFQLSHEHNVSLSALYSQEQMYGYFDRPNYTGNFSWKNKNTIVSARLRSIFDDFFLSDFILSLSTAKSSTQQPRNAIELYDIQELSVKQDFTVIVPANEFHIGGWLIVEQEDITIDLPREVALNFDELQLRGKGKSVKPSMYIDDKWTVSSTLTAGLGVRYDYISKSNESTVSPRGNISYAWNDHMSLSLDYGWYFQSPRPFELDINNRLQSRRAESYGIGIKHEVGDEIVVSLELYNKNLSRLIAIDSLWNLSNNGNGYSRGAEFYVQLKDPRGFFGWLSYTYSFSKRKEGSNNDLHYFDYDRPHLISLVANYKF